ncbi:MAG: TOBE domain-containing protein [Thiovulaceae bacterium]|nr:TOBE domain-containing protein [Sulfurimonadaceae bacterium]
MNTIKATVTEIQNFERISFLELKTQINTLALVALEIDERVKVGTVVTLLVKATNVALAKKRVEDISLSNQLECLIKEIQIGTLLSSVTLHVEENILESIITTKSLHKLDLHVNDKAVALIKASDLSIASIE